MRNACVHATSRNVHKLCKINTLIEFSMQLLLVTLMDIKRIYYLTYYTYVEIFCGSNFMLDLNQYFFIEVILTSIRNHYRLLYSD